MLKVLGAAGTMVAGCGLVLGLVWAMNGATQQAPRESASRQTQIDVDKRQKKKTIERKVRPKVKPRPSQARAQAPPPSIGGRIGGVDLDMPGFASPISLGAMQAAVGDTREARDMVMTESSVDSPPRPVRRASPSFPPRARARGLEGKVVLNLLVGERGQVLRVKVLDSDPPGVFDSAAVDAAQRWEFEPAVYKGARVRMWARVPLVFKLT